MHLIDVFYALIIIALISLITKSFGSEKELSLSEKIYLNLSDCDGMCNHCKGKLKQICMKNKGNTTYPTVQPSLENIVHNTYVYLFENDNLF